MFYCIIFCLFCIIVTKLSLEAACNSIYRNKNRNVSHGMGQPNHFLLIDEEWKWMHRHTNDIYGKTFCLPFSAFIYIKARFLYKTMHHHTVQTSCKIFYKKHSIHVLSKHTDTPPRHSPLGCSPSIITLEIKWKKKYMKIDLTSRLRERELKKRIESVWKDTACNLPAIQRSLKQFVGRLRTVKKEKANISKWFMVKIYLSFNFFVQFQVFDTASCNFWHENILWTQTVKKGKKVKTTIDVKVWTNGNYAFPFIF